MRMVQRDITVAGATPVRRTGLGPYRLLCLLLAATLRSAQPSATALFRPRCYSVQQSP